MTEPVYFDDTTPRFSLPMLYAAQAQKEFFVNEALCRADALIQCVVEGTTLAEPAGATNGQNWIVGPGATGPFVGQVDKIACRQQGQWLFIAPTPLMRVHDRSISKERRYDNGWSCATEIAMPSDGATIDSEARQAIAGLHAALIAAGILSGEQEIAS